MLRTRKVRHVALAGILATALVATGVATAPGAGASDRTKVLREINRVRLNHGLNALTMNKRLARDAAAHTRKMIRRGKLFDPPHLAQLLEPYDWRSIGADVVGCQDTAHKIMKQWMSEKLHRSIILHPDLERAGVGAIRVDGRSACGRDKLWTTAIMYG